MRMYAKCECGQFNLVYECVGQNVSCKKCGQSVRTQLEDLKSEHYKLKEVERDRLRELRNQPVPDQKLQRRRSCGTTR